MANIYLIGAPEPTFDTLAGALAAARAEADDTGRPVPVFEAQDGGVAREHTIVFPYIEEGVPA